MIAPTPVAFDFEQDAAPPDWLVDGVIERGTVTLLSGDTAAGKSLIADALAVAVLQGGSWLGLDVESGRVIVIDAENHRRLVRDRLKAFGLRNEDREGLRYYLRAGVALGEADWNDWLSTEVQQHRADLVVIDTTASTTAVDLNSNNEVADLYRDALRPATLNGAAILMLHHERKPSTDYARNASTAALGAREWVGQADGHLAIRATGRLSSEAMGEDGHTRQRYPIALEMPKVRDGQPALPAGLAIVSERDAEDRFVWMRVEAEGSARAGSVTPSRADRIVRYVQTAGGTVTPAEIAAGLNASATAGSFKTALQTVVTQGRVVRVGHGQYTDAGE